MLKIATYNIEWFDGLFDAQDQLIRDDELCGRSRRGPQVTRREQADAIRDVLTLIDPDLILIVEAPNDGARSKRSTIKALEAFAAIYGLRQRRALHGFSSPTHQEIALLYDPDRLSAAHEPIGALLDEAGAAQIPPLEAMRLAQGEAVQPFPASPRFDGVCPWRLMEGEPTALAAFSRPPLEAAIEDLASGRRFRLIGAHLKSQNPRRYPADGPGDALQAVQLRHLGQCVWLRARIAEHLAAGEDVAVLGDFNEMLGEPPPVAALGCSGLDVIVGAGEAQLALDPDSAPSPQGFSPRIDFAMLSPGLTRFGAPEWRFWSPLSAPSITQALHAASDHLPVSVTLTLSAPPAA